MAKLKIRGSVLKKMGFPSGKAASLVITAVRTHYKHASKATVMQLLAELIRTPENFANDPVWQPIVKELSADIEAERNAFVQLNTTTPAYPIFGAENIEKGALDQMATAMRLPVSRKGALMPDAHQGYGLPIGGVLATENSIIPYAVGMDIGCRMCLSIYPMSLDLLEKKKSKFKQLLNENSRFGISAFDRPMEDEVLDRSLFKEIPLLKRLQQKAQQQIGSSGSGNHFVEFGIVEIFEEDKKMAVPKGKYLGLLSHSGSRGLGANIARHYTNIAMEACPLPKEARHLAWLDLDTSAGQEYWLAMNLAGDYASACHHHIHQRMNTALGIQPIGVVENHHNFAWKEQLEDGASVVVHRKGATPAGKGVLGVIPGSMTAPGYIVRGKGNSASLDSAAHGAGRAMSRRKAKNSITQYELKRFLKEKGVDLIGGGLDEAPLAYKDINEVMAAQKQLVDVLGSFLPKIVRMAGD